MGSGQSAGDVGGFRIFKVYDGGPASESNLEVFFDYIVEIGGVKMDSDQRRFSQKVREAENVRTKLLVYNSRTHTSRDVFVIPRKWGGAGLLGAVVRYDSLSNADNQGIRVLDVFPNSPALEAGLVPYKDYVLGTPEVMFRDLDELIEIVNLCVGKSLQLSVYNSDSESIRDVTILPNTGWGGDGSIGADIRTGFLHRIPAPRRPFIFGQTQPPPTLQPALYPVSAQVALGTANALPEGIPPAAAIEAPEVPERALEAPAAAAPSEAVPATTVPEVAAEPAEPAEPAGTACETSAGPAPAAQAPSTTQADAPSAAEPVVPMLVQAPPAEQRTLTMEAEADADPSAAPGGPLGAQVLGTAALAVAEAEAAEPTAPAPAVTRAPDPPLGQLGSADGSSGPVEVVRCLASPAVDDPEVSSPVHEDLSLVASALEDSDPRGSDEAGNRRTESDSPRQNALPTAEPCTPAAEGPPRVPPPTPIDVSETNQSDAVPMMSPSVMHIPSPLQSRAEGLAAAGSIFDLSPPAPGVIYEVPMPQA